MTKAKFPGQRDFHDFALVAHVLATSASKKREDPFERQLYMSDLGVTREKLESHSTEIATWEVKINSTL